MNDRRSTKPNSLANRNPAAWPGPLDRLVGRLSGLCLLPLPAVFAFVFFGLVLLPSSLVFVVPSSLSSHPFRQIAGPAFESRDSSSWSFRATPSLGMWSNASAVFFVRLSSLSSHPFSRIAGPASERRDSSSLSFRATRSLGMWSNASAVFFVRPSSLSIHPFSRLAGTASERRDSSSLSF